MVDFLFLALPNQPAYESLKTPIQFPEHLQPYSCWAFKSPLTIYSVDLKQSHVFLDGRVQIENVECPTLQEKWKYFVLTKSDNSKLYCTSYVFYEKIALKVPNSSFFSLKYHSQVFMEYYVPKCLVLRSSKPYFKLQTNLIKIHRELRRNNSCIFLQVNKDSMSRSIISNSIDEFMKISRTSLVGFDRTKMMSQVLGKLPITQEIMFGYYVAATNTALEGEKIYIAAQNNFQILHLYNISDSIFRVNYFFHMPISISNLFTIISAILQEKQIIFTSSNQNSNLMLMQTIIEMLQPLKWEYMYAPNLPETMLDAAEYSFMPYMVGMHRKFLDRVTLSGRVTVHVENDIIETDEDIPPLPDVLKYILMIPMGRPPSEHSLIQRECHIRTKSVLLVSTLLEQFPIVENRQVENPFYSFYKYFFQKSAMYQTFKRQIKNQANIEISELMWLPLEIKLQMVESRFKQRIRQANYPIICQNEQEWMKYYDHHFEKSRRSLKNQNKPVSHIASSMVFLRASIGGEHQLREERKMRQQASKKGIGFAQSLVHY